MCENSVGGGMAHRQLGFDWAATRPVTSKAEEDASTTADLTSANLPSCASVDEARTTREAPRPQHTAQRAARDHGRLASQWDFRRTFPQPLEEAIDAGVIDGDQLDEASIRSMHDELARQCLCVMADLDALREASERGINPLTGKAPRTAKQRAKLDALLREEPLRLRRELDETMDAYATAFGDDATQAFRRTLDEWHQSGDVDRASPCEPPAVDYRDTDGLPVGAPNPAAVANGAFGRDETGELVSPKDEEATEITDSLAEELRKILHLTRDCGGEKGRVQTAAAEELRRQYAESLKRYETDFGVEAAQRLDAWVRRQAATEHDEPTQYDPGHPWHYLPDGDDAKPVPVSEIPASNVERSHLNIKLPKDRKKRAARLRQILADQQTQLEADEARYEELIANGAAALSRYDREIAHGGNDALAWASAIALKFNHIAGGRGRVASLQAELGGRGGIR